MTVGPVYAQQGVIGSRLGIKPTSTQRYYLQVFVVVRKNETEKTRSSNLAVTCLRFMVLHNFQNPNSVETPTRPRIRLSTTVRTMSLQFRLDCVTSEIKKINEALHGNGSYGTLSVHTGGEDARDLMREQLTERLTLRKELERQLQPCHSPPATQAPGGIDPPTGIERPHMYLLRQVITHIEMPLIRDLGGLFLLM